MVGLLYDLIIQEEYIKTGFLFVSMIGIFLLVANISIKIANRIVLFFEAKKSLKDFIKSIVNNKEIILKLNLLRISRKVYDLTWLE